MGTGGWYPVVGGKDPFNVRSSGLSIEGLCRCNVRDKDGLAGKESKRGCFGRVRQVLRVWADS